MRTAAQVMTDDPLAVRPDDTFELCAEVMKVLGFRHLPVVTATGKLAGMVSDATIFEHGGFARDGQWVPSRPDLDRATIARAVRPAEALDPGVPLAQAVQRLLALDDVVVFVDREQVPVGLLTEHDLLRLAARELPATLRVRDVMATSIVTAEPDTTLEEAWADMQEHGIRHLPIREGRRVVGVASVRDLARASGSVVAGGTLGQLVDLDRPLVTTSGDAPLARAAEAMAEHKIGCLPVLAGDGSLEGLVTATDAIKALLAALD